MAGQGPEREIGRGSGPKREVGKGHGPEGELGRGIGQDPEEEEKTDPGNGKMHLLSV